MALTAGLRQVSVDKYLFNAAKDGLLLDFQVEEQFDFFNLVIIPYET